MTEKTVDSMFVLAASGFVVVGYGLVLTLEWYKRYACTILPKFFVRIDEELYAA